jgi:hypothetical protein
MRCRITSSILVVFIVAFAFAGCSDGVRNPNPVGVVPEGVTQSAARAASATPCPQRAIFVRRFGEIRGYPLSASGTTTACAVISGVHSHISSGLPYGYMEVNSSGDLHALSFQSGDQYVLAIMPSNANGDAPPSRLVGAGPDAVALAVDSHDYDYIVAGENYPEDNCWFVAKSGAREPSAINCDPQLVAIEALAMDANDDLIVAGRDSATGAARVDVISKPSAPAPEMVRSIEGSHTTLAAADSMAIAIAPVTGDLYVFERAPGKPAVISVFAAGARGNAGPIRTILGSMAKLPPSAFAVNVIAVDDSGYLYVTSTGGTIYVYGPTAAGAAAPVREITDPAAASAFTAPGIGLRL